MRWPSPRLAAYAAMAGSLLLLLFAPIHAAAYFDTPAGREDLFPHQTAAGEAVRGALPAAFGFAEPYEVYLTWGKVTASGIALLAFGVIALHGTRDGTMTRGARALGRAMCTAWALLAAAALLEYVTPWTDTIFLVALPSLLATIVLTAAYGILHARRRTWPRWVPAALAASAILFIPLVILAGHIPMGAWAWAIAWLAIGSWLLRTRAG